MVSEAAGTKANTSRSCRSAAPAAHGCNAFGHDQLIVNTTSAFVPAPYNNVPCTLTPVNVV